MLMGHVIHISFDLPWGDLISQSEWFCWKVAHSKHNSVVILPIAINEVLIACQFCWLGEVSTGQASGMKWS